MIASDNPTNAACRGGHGEAALLLVESLLHTLIECKALSRADAITVVEVALDAQSAVCDARKQPELQRIGVHQLGTIVRTLKIDEVVGQAE